MKFSLKPFLLVTLLFALFTPLPDKGNHVNGISYIHFKSVCSVYQINTNIEATKVVVDLKQAHTSDAKNVLTNYSFKTPCFIIPKAYWYCYLSRADLPTHVNEDIPWYIVQRSWQMQLSIS